MENNGIDLFIIHPFLRPELWQWCQSDDDENENTTLPLQASDEFNSSSATGDFN